MAILASHLLITTRNQPVEIRIFWRRFFWCSESSSSPSFRWLLGPCPGSHTLIVGGWSPLVENMLKSNGKNLPRFFFFNMTILNQESWKNYHQKKTHTQYAVQTSPPAPTKSSAFFWKLKLIPDFIQGTWGSQADRPSFKSSRLPLEGCIEKW